MIFTGNQDLHHALNEFNLETDESQDKHLSFGSKDLACLIHYYINCNSIKNGKGKEIPSLRMMPFLSNCLANLKR